MAHKALIDAVKARLGSTWNGLAVVEMNRQGETDAAGGEFIVLQFPASRTTRPTVNQPYYREEGGFRLVMNMNRGVGLDDVAAKADALAALFRDQTFSGVVCGVPSAPFFDDSNDQGAYFSAQIVVPYAFHYSS